MRNILQWVQRGKSAGSLSGICGRVIPHCATSQQGPFSNHSQPASSHNQFPIKYFDNYFQALAPLNQLSNQQISIKFCYLNFFRSHRCFWTTLKLMVIWEKSKQGKLSSYFPFDLIQFQKHHTRITHFHSLSTFAAKDFCTTLVIHDIH